MASTKGKDKKSKAPKGGKAKGDKAPKRKVRAPLMDRVTNLVLVLFLLSLVAQQLAS